MQLVRVAPAPATEQVPFGDRISHEDAIFLALVLNSDYGPGVLGCGVQQAMSLCRRGFGSTLLKALSSSDVTGALADWHEALSDLYTERALTTPPLSAWSQFPCLEAVGLFLNPLVSGADCWALAGACDLTMQIQ